MMEEKMETDEPAPSEAEEKPVASAVEGHVHLGDAGLEDEDDEVDDEAGEESEGDEVESIEDIKIQNGVFKYRVRWVGCKPSEDTWEPEESFTGSESKALLEEFREAHKDKVEQLLKNQKARRSKRTKRGPRWEYVSEIVTREADDVFYGKPAAELADAPSELKKLFDPTHKNTATELFLTTTDPSVKVTRSQTKALIGSSREASRSNTPTLSSKLLTPDDTSRGSASPTPQPTAKGRQRKSKAPPKKVTKRKVAEPKEDAEIPAETVVVSVAENQTPPLSTSDKPPIVLKLTLKKADVPAKKEKRSSSEKSPKPKEKKKKEKKLSVDTVLSPPLSHQTEKKLSTQETEMEVDQPSSHSATKIISSTEESVVEAKTKTSPPGPENSEPPPPPTGRRRALHLLPGPISINEPLTAQVLNNMLRELEIKYYGDEERHPYSQDQFNEAILSGNFMRVRKAMVNNVLTAPRLAMWANPYGANLLHLLCRTTKCDGRHAGDDIATVLCNIAPSLLCGRDSIGKIPLHDAVDKGQVCRVIRLLTFHSPVNVVDRNGNSPLSLAYSKNHAKMVKILLQAGAAFHFLENAERRKPENLRKRRAYDVLTKHSRIISNQLQKARRKVYRLLTEVRTASPCFLAPFSDGPNFSFNFSHTAVPFPDNGQYAYVLFLHVCSVKAEGGVWQTRCWGGLRLAQAPMHNGRPLEPTSVVERGDHMIFFIHPVNGVNTVQIRIGDSEMSKKVILAVQVVLVKRAVRENWSSSHSNYPPLEQAPMIGPY
ncbi:Ankyrin repeat protein [Trichostrongylus colubriformis]|uniref:Ankyrin repeat protein n=1 Tax=Trichostrongylus colubriformis TaxID=6319 RepID=A0AAN8I971_TRICO